MKKNISVYISPEGEPHRALIERIARSGVPADATVIFSQRNTIYTIPSGGITVNIKQFALPNLINRYVYGNLREGKARRSFANSQRLTRLGFRVPSPLAFIEERTRVRFWRSYFISEHIDGLTEMRSISRHPFVGELLVAVGREMARIHAAGVWMKDFSPGNILFRRLSDGSFEFYYVDLNRIEFDVTDRSKLDRMWERLIFDPAQLTIAAEAYAEATGLDPADVTATAVRQMRSFVRRKHPVIQP